MSDDVLSLDERALMEVYAQVRPPVAAIRARVGATLPPKSAAGATRRGLALALFAATAVAAALVVGTRGLHGGELRGAVPPAPARTAAATPTSLALPTCVLPVSDDGADESRLVAFPAGTYAAGPPVAEQGDRFNGWSMAWDAPLHRWVHSTWNLVSPDGRMWLYRVGVGPDTLGALHIADADGHDRLLSLPGATQLFAAPSPLGWLPEGILYAAGSHDAPTLRFYDPATGGSRDAGVPSGDWRWYGGTSLWRVSYFRPANTVLSYDLATHRQTAWFSVDQYLGPMPPQTHTMTPAGPMHTPEENRRAIELLAVDAQGHPVVNLGTRDPGTDMQTLYLDAPGHVVVIEHAVVPQNPLDPTSAIGDVHGVWFLSYTGRVYLYRPEVGLRLVGRAPAWSSQSVTLITGPCR